MAATDQTYRNQKALDVVFAVSCVLMLLTTLWMYAQDYNREWKAAQRTFRDVDETLNEHLMLEKMPSAEQMDERRRDVKDARRTVEKVEKRLGPDMQRLYAQRDTQDNRYREIKADFDSKTSYYNIAIEHLGRADEKHQVALRKDVDARKQELDNLQKQLNNAEIDLQRTAREINDLEKTSVSVRVAGEDKELTLESARAELARAEREEKNLTRQFDTYAKNTVKGRWKAGDVFRNLPILDAFAPPLKINQIWLPDLTIDYSFKEVPRFDRCTSCHLGIDQPQYDRAALAGLGDESRRGQLHDKLIKAQEIFLERKNSGEKLGFDPNDLPVEGRGSAWAPAVFVFLAGLLIGVVLGVVEHSIRLAVRITTISAFLTLLWGVGVALFAPSDPAVRILKLTPAQLTEYCAHPRLDLFAHANSPHPAEKFGCTICHAGQGSATDFLLASHSPADVQQEEHWHKEYGWEANHFWDFPMLSKRFVESSCLKCHQQVTDLIRYGNKEEAPKLLKGYNLVRENGCFGCHDISGIKGSAAGYRAVGPDLRLEPQPALEYLTSTEQEKAQSDPNNPAGTFRKVGPSLRRLAEKTNESWTRAWLYSPRGFRPDTRMPHFYNLANNTNDPNAAEPLPPEQKEFPAVEMHSIAYYLIRESQAGLDGQDTTRKVLEARLQDLHNILKNGPLPEKDRKDLIDVTRRLIDMGLLSASLRATEINAIATKLKDLQERMQELPGEQADLEAKIGRGNLPPRDKRAMEDRLKEVKAALQAGKTALGELAARLSEAGKPDPLSRQLVTQDGTVVKARQEKGKPKYPDVSVPANDKEKAERVALGQELFKEKGCLACHSHDAALLYKHEVEDENGKKQEKSFYSQANFAPNLSRIAAKIVPAGGEEARRLWLVQWIMNPNIHFSRTRMPITHLSMPQAAAVAEWLLSVPVKPGDWKERDVLKDDPKMVDLVKLARVYLAKAPGMTRQDVEDFLPETDNPPGILDAKRLQQVKEQSPDADELRLEAPIDRGKLEWYIGRKSIGRLGCFGCHDIPGFEQSKPIGTALNDWGRKDPERLAFEDADIYVQKVYHVVKTRDDPEDSKKPAADWQAQELSDGHKKMPFEKIFFEALSHHRREGFLHLKLEQPRSYDYHRLRTWDDRLRMPQFRFARSVKRPGESEEDFDVRQSFEEAEAREAVMTFILGLVGEPVNSKYLNKPNPDRLAEIKGRQVLDKFNCAGCHQVRPGVYEIKPNEQTEKLLQEAYRKELRGAAGAYHFAYHNGWVGLPQPSPDRWIAYGTPPLALPLKEGDDKPDPNEIRLSDALRFSGSDGVVRDLPAGAKVSLPPGRVEQVGPFGGTFTELMIPYAYKIKKKEDEQNARSILPPPLHREGERVQPNWLYGFLRNPEVIRPEGFMLLRMPKFNMSSDEATVLVDYFSSAARLSNPGAGVTAQYQAVEQRDPEYWQRRTREYVAGLVEAKLLEARSKEMEQAWEQDVKVKIAEAEAGLPAAKQAVENEKETGAKADKQKELERREAAIKKWKEQLARNGPAKVRFPEQYDDWVTKEAYATDAFRSIANKNLCLQCHDIGNLTIVGPKGPNLALTARRLRPEWVKLWSANPARMFTYSPIMPQNFPDSKDAIQQLKLPFMGTMATPENVVEAARDVLMDLQRVSELPGTRVLVPVAAPAGGKE
jgi:mono/diheme cytochrome c family protein